jgi:outer membrane immunogenic protein
MMRRFGLAVALVGLIGASAGAADTDPSAPVEALEATQLNPDPWSGLYIGALLGYSFGDADAGRTGDIDADGAEGGVYAGANYQIGDRLVLGVEGDVLASGVEGGRGGVGFEQDWVGSLRGRVGVALDDFLLYGTGGVAATGLEASSGAFRDRDTAFGWTLGAGVETALSERVTARVEYRYTEFEDKVFRLDEPRGLDLGGSTIRAGIGFKF